MLCRLGVVCLLSGHAASAVGAANDGAKIARRGSILFCMLTDVLFLEKVEMYEAADYISPQLFRFMHVI
jgi:hypothetical protein